jgi:hypothetical protein
VRPVYVEQKLVDCEVCCSALALEYHWNGGRLPSAGHDRVQVRAFHCPACNHLNAFFTLLYAYGFALKTVPGPDVDGRVHPNGVRRLQSLARPTFRS